MPPVENQWDRTTKAFIQSSLDKLVVSSWVLFINSDAMKSFIFCWPFIYAFVEFISRIEIVGS